MTLPDRPQGPIDRAALERILQRAAELQAGEMGSGERLSTDEVIALGKEVGIPAHHLQQAMLEEQTRGTVGVAAAGGMLDRIAGPGWIGAHRVLSATPEAIGDALSAYLETQELFCLQRRTRNNITFEPLGGFQAAIRRSTAAFGQGRKPFFLDKASGVSAVLTPLESGYVHVLLQADVRGLRGGFLGGGALLASTGAAGTLILGVLGAFLPVALIPLPVGLVAGWVAVRQFPGKLQRIQLGLERALDHVEEGAVKPKHQLPPQRPAGLLGAIVDEVRKGLNKPQP